jgi:hypothetical protein
MNAPAETSGRRFQPRPLVAGQVQATAFSWQPILNLPNRETVRARSARRGWRSLLLDRHP